MMVDRNIYEQVDWLNAFNEACGKGKINKVTELLESPHANVNLYDPIQHRGPLHWACINNRVKVVKMLLAAGAKNTIEERRGLDPIQHAIPQGFHQIVRACLDSGVDPNYQREPESTCPMSKAAIEGDEAMVKMMVKYGGVIEPWMIKVARANRDEDWVLYLEHLSAQMVNKALREDESVRPGTKSPKVRKGL